MTSKMVKAQNITPTMKGWNGEATDIFKETENGIPTGNLAILWFTDEGQMRTTIHDREDLIEVFLT